MFKLYQFTAILSKKPNLVETRDGKLRVHLVGEDSRYGQDSRVAKDRKIFGNPAVFGSGSGKEEAS